MERFLSAALDHSVEFDQPRMWSTKGQTLRTFLTQTGRPQADLTSTTSCWQKRAVVNLGGKRRQCGLCAACLLRRMSMQDRKSGVSGKSVSVRVDFCGHRVLKKTK